MAVSLPCTPFGLAESEYTPAGRILAADGILALATDCNPGTAWCESMQFVMALACRALKLTPAQALAAVALRRMAWPDLALVFEEPDLPTRAGARWPYLVGLALGIAGPGSIVMRRATKGEAAAHAEETTRAAAAIAAEFSARTDGQGVSPEGGLVELDARVDGLVALIVVRDEGQGIERADLERVFRPFARLEGHERIPGTGLGLPISRDLARAMGGDVVVASVPASGSAFIIGLPAVAEIPRGAVAAALRDAIEVEEIGLEERAVLRALRAEGTVGGRAVAGRAGGRRTAGDARGRGDATSVVERADGEPQTAGMPEIDAA